MWRQAVLLLIVLLVPVHTYAQSAPAEPPRGRIIGWVLDVDSGQPVAGATLTIDHRGDATSVSATRRAVEQGLHVNGVNGRDGTYELAKVALRGDHPLIITHPPNLRQVQTVALSDAQVAVKLDIRLRPAGSIEGTLVDAAGASVGKMGIRVSAADGRPLDFRKSWAPLSFLTVTADQQGRFTVGGLDTGEFTVEAFHGTKGTVTYHGQAAGINVLAGKPSTVKVKPAAGGGTIVVVAPAAPAERPRGNFSGMPIIMLSRDLGPPAWCRGVYHPEDDRLLHMSRLVLLRRPLDDQRRAEKRPAGLGQKVASGTLEPPPRCRSRQWVVPARAMGRVRYYSSQAGSAGIFGPLIHRWNRPKSTWSTSPSPSKSARRRLRRQPPESTATPAMVFGQLSQASPTESPSVFSWSGLGVEGQLSHASPTPSASVSNWSGLGIDGQTSAQSAAPSPSESVTR